VDEGQHDTRSGGALRTGVVIPAHDEQRSITRLLSGLLHDAHENEFEIVVVCNGCTDDTAAVARSVGGPVRVVETPVASKPAALRLGDDSVQGFPRIYVDADVEIGAAGLRALADSVRDSEALAAGPNRRLDMSGVSLAVRWYYDVWQELPQVREGLFGRGVIAVSAAGHDRIRRLTPVMSDDLAISEAFAESERLIVREAVVGIRPPKTMRDLLRRRIRVATGTAQLDHAAMRSAQAKTSLSTLAQLARRQPRLAARIPVFLAVGLAAKLGAQRRVRAGDYMTWLRDESSRL
jgi:hypothetical protein